MRKKPVRESSPAEELDLPVVVTGIKPQKNNPNRFSLFHDDQFIAGVSSGTMSALNLGKGVTITSGLLEKIREEEQKNAVDAYLLRLLEQRDHSRSELRRKAFNKGYTDSVIDTALDRLEEKNYLNDETFVRSYASDKLQRYRWGPYKVRAELQKKGVPTGIVDRVLSDLCEDLELKKNCVDLVLKRKRHFSREKDEHKRKNKIVAYLRQRGFSFDTINRAMPDITQSLNV